MIWIRNVLLVNKKIQITLNLKKFQNQFEINLCKVKIELPFSKYLEAWKTIAPKHTQARLIIALISSFVFVILALFFFFLFLTLPHVYNYCLFLFLTIILERFDFSQKKSSFF